MASLLCVYILFVNKRGMSLALVRGIWKYEYTVLQATIIDTVHGGY